MNLKTQKTRGVTIGSFEGSKYKTEDSSPLTLALRRNSSIRFVPNLKKLQKLPPRTAISNIKPNPIPKFASSPLKIVKESKNE